MSLSLVGSVTPDYSKPCDQRWENEQNGLPWSILAVVDGKDRVRKMFLSQCCRDKATALINNLGPDYVNQFTAACVQSNGSLNSIDGFTGIVAGGSEGIFSYTGIDLGGGTGKIDATTANITKAVVAFVVIMLALLAFYFTFSKAK